ncbi:hypothetical protein L226DRAFT_361469 [Lentinus tigrinus ALCF2SS1-7]|uniref:uncharacterized protein n=1 Tax=Lentinus tigrinus ALCF2SS1-7 TaxID=1328758 RepID=UPI001165E650|nr:hypothetical protein L226DRAFT_361469 [Lentinus tigrinus ALCF2SS1-7]
MLPPQRRTETYEWNITVQDNYFMAFAIQQHRRSWRTTTSYLQHFRYIDAREAKRKYVVPHSNNDVHGILRHTTPYGEVVDTK